MYDYISFDALAVISFPTPAPLIDKQFLNAYYTRAQNIFFKRMYLSQRRVRALARLDVNYRPRRRIHHACILRIDYIHIIYGSILFLYHANKYTRAAPLYRVYHHRLPEKNAYARTTYPDTRAVANTSCRRRLTQLLLLYEHFLVFNPNRLLSVKIISLRFPLLQPLSLNCLHIGKSTFAFLIV